LLRKILRLTHNPSLDLWNKIIDELSQLSFSIQSVQASLKKELPSTPDIQVTEENVEREAIETMAAEEQYPHQEESISEKPLEIELSSAKNNSTNTPQDRMQALEKIDEISDIDVAEDINDQHQDQTHTFMFETTEKKHSEEKPPTKAP
jgi:conjugal transfer/entry exclusion protein